MERSQESVAQRLNPPLPSHGWRNWLGPLAVGAVAGVLRFTNLGTPNEVVFDETYYAKDAWGLLRFGVEHQEVEGHEELMLSAGDAWRTIPAFTNEGSFVVHPPVGKWTIAAGEYLFGVSPFGWRFMVALLGTIAVIALARIVRRLSRSDTLGVIAGLLLALDGIHLVLSRTALVDLTLGFWVLLAFGALLLDRDHTRARLARGVLADGFANSRLGPWLGARPWRWIAILCLGLACASKWSGAWFALAFIVLSLFWDAGARRAIGVKRPYLGALALDAPMALLGTGIGVLAVYLASWTGWFVTETGWGRTWAADKGPSPVPGLFRGFWHYHWQMWNFHTTLGSEHSYQSNPLSWPFMSRPTSFHYDGDVTGCGADKCASEVLALGNPIIWWAALLAVPYQLWCWIARRDWCAGAAIVGIAAGWLPWMLYLDRTVFTFYTVVYVPFVVMAVTLSLGAILGPRDAGERRRRTGVILVTAYLVAVVAAAWFFYPIWTGETIPYESWRLRMWLPTWV